jgi:hypothetical protein
MLKGMKEQEVIKGVKSVWSLPVMLIRKNRDIRFSVNYRLLNKVSDEAILPLRRTDDTEDTFIKAMHLGKFPMEQRTLFCNHCNFKM